MIRLDAATVLLQWATGGMLFCWFTTRRRMVGLGYGWLLRGVYAGFAVGAFAVGVRFDAVAAREAASLGVALSCIVGLGVSVARKSAGVSGQRAEFDRRSARVAAMTGIDRAIDVEPRRDARTDRGPDPGRDAGSDQIDGRVAGSGRDAGSDSTADRAGESTSEVDPRSDAHDGPPGAHGREFPPWLDLVPVLIGTLGLLAAAVDAATDGGAADTAVAIARTLVGAAFLGALTDAMLLGHWYLVQPGLPRQMLNEIVTAVGWLWPFELLVMLLPTGMFAVFTGEVDDGWGGMLGWTWAACAISTIVLVAVTRAALRERYYSAVMAATGLLYLAILTGFGMDIVARAVLDGT